MDKLRMQSLDKTKYNVEKLKELFPNAVTEVQRDGKTDYAIDFDILKQELSSELVEGREERYQFSWPDKRNSILLANSPIRATLRPCKEESVDFDSTQNLYIEGDNLDVLKLLQETYLHSIDVIYIDPPYNTGRNLIYHNDFAQDANEYLSRSAQVDVEGNRLVLNKESEGRFHTNWLNMIYPRLKLAKELLSESGIIVLTIDDCEIETVTMVMNEIFGGGNRLATIVIKNNPSGRSTVTGASISHEYALIYAANSSVKLGRLPRSEKQISRYGESDEKGKFEWVNFRKHGGYKEDAPTMYFPIYIKKDGSDFRIPKLEWQEDSREYKILEKQNNDEFISYPVDENNRPRRWKWSLERARSDRANMAVRKDASNKFAIYIKSRMKDEGMLPLTVWDDTRYSSTEYGTNFLTELMGKRFFDYPKSIYAVLDCLQVANAFEKRNCTILDFFSGSATTAHAVMQLNVKDGGHRKFIMVQVPEKCGEESEAFKAGFKTICQIGKERIRCAGKKILEENPSARGSLDVGFRVLKLDSSNMEEVYYDPVSTKQQELIVKNVKDDRGALDLLFQALLEFDKPLSSKIEETEICGKTVFKVDGDDMICCLDEGNISDEVVEAITKLKPLYAIFRDSSFADDSVRVNCDQLFAKFSPKTVCRVI